MAKLSGLLAVYDGSDNDAQGVSDIYFTNYDLCLIPPKYLLIRELQLVAVLLVIRKEYYFFACSTIVDRKFVKYHCAFSWNDYFEQVFCPIKKFSFSHNRDLKLFKGGL